MQAALELLSRSGYEGATTKAIAARAGMSEMTLFRQFATKAELMRQALDQATSSFGSAVTEPTDDVEADLVALADGYATFIDGAPELVGRVLVETPHDTEVGAIGRSVLRSNTADVKRLLDHHRRAGRLADMPLDDLVRDFLGPLLARSMLRAALMPDRFDGPAHVRRYLNGHRPVEPAV